mmetsp:Transcript_13338/g.28525  ORF Transcript_13338/g.28525 Transcript_13338/m.28525 type:complete len:344 (+) Transcript_13338:279-1310(+)
MRKHALPLYSCARPAPCQVFIVLELRPPSALYLDGLVNVAIVLSQGLLAVHHAGASLVAQALDCCSRDVLHSHSQHHGPPDGQSGQLSLILIVLHQVLHEGSDAGLLVARPQHVIRVDLSTLALHHLCLSLVIKLQLVAQGPEGVLGHLDGALPEVLKLNLVTVKVTVLDAQGSQGVGVHLLQGPAGEDVGADKLATEQAAGVLTAAWAKGAVVSHSVSLSHGASGLQVRECCCNLALLLLAVLQQVQGVHGQNINTSVVKGGQAAGAQLLILISIILQSCSLNLKIGKLGQSNLALLVVLQNEGRHLVTGLVVLGHGLHLNVHVLGHQVTVLPLSQLLSRES